MVQKRDGEKGRESTEKLMYTNQAPFLSACSASGCQGVPPRTVVTFFCTTAKFKHRVHPMLIFCLTELTGDVFPFFNIG